MIVGIKDRSEGFTGKEAHDIRFIRTREDIFEDRYGKWKKKPTTARFNQPTEREGS
jgi:hypothetical protein